MIIFLISNLIDVEKSINLKVVALIELYKKETCLL